VSATSRYDLDRDGWSELLVGEPRFRLEQVWNGLYHQGRDLSELTTLPGPLRERLAADAPLALTEVTEAVTDGGDTVKFLWELEGGARVETVLMHYADRSTVFLSTQAGCAMGCSFCATGQAGFERHLSTGEIVEQLARARRRAAEGATPRRVSNIVFMGMGEPLANYDSTWAAIRRIHRDMEIGARHLTVSTVGLVPGILRMAAEELPVGLAVSLHAADDALRDELVPINRTYPLPVLMSACEEYVEATHRRLSFEWAMIDGVNDRFVDAERLAALARPLRTCEPDPAEPDTRLRGARLLGQPRPRLPRRAGAPGGQRDRARHARHRDRRSVRPAAGRPRGDAGAPTATPHHRLTPSGERLPRRPHCRLSARAPCASPRMASTRTSPRATVEPGPRPSADGAPHHAPRPPPAHRRTR
jgi:23S rRNA (adenine2503-C2)-methyltransferase